MRLLRRLQRLLSPVTRATVGSPILGSPAVITTGDQAEERVLIWLAEQGYIDFEVVKSLGSQSHTGYFDFNVRVGFGTYAIMVYPDGRVVSGLAPALPPASQVWAELDSLGYDWGYIIGQLDSRTDTIWKEESTNVVWNLGYRDGYKRNPHRFNAGLIRTLMAVVRMVQEIAGSLETDDRADFYSLIRSHYGPDEGSEREVAEKLGAGSERLRAAHRRFLEFLEGLDLS